MPGRRSFLRSLCSGIGIVLAGCLDGQDGTDEERGSTSVTSTVSQPTVDDETALQLSSPAFEDGGSIPAKYTYDGADVSPPLSIADVPDEAESLVLVVDDPDAPNPPFTHWLLWNVATDTKSIPEGIEQSRTVAALDGAKQGTNSFGELGYRGPRPPKGDGPHTYRFTLSAVSSSLNVQAGARRDVVTEALQDTLVATARTTGEYER